jgi:hypothetical protein
MRSGLIFFILPSESLLILEYIHEKYYFVKFELLLRKNVGTSQSTFHQQTFDQMMNKFHLKQKALAAVLVSQGITPSLHTAEILVSRFRRGQADLGSSRFVVVLNAVPIEARQWYLSQVFGVEVSLSWRSLLSNLDAQGWSELFAAIAEETANQASPFRKSTEEKTMEAVL